MEFDLQRFVAIFLGYLVPIALWWLLSRRVPALWPLGPRVELARPKLDLLAAIAAAVAVFGLNVLYNMDRLVPPGAPGWRGDLVFLVNLVIIWSPIAVVLIWRRQGPATCLFSLHGLGRKLLWALAASVLGMAVFLLVEGRIGEPGLLAAMAGELDAIKALQSLIQFFALGFLLVRIVAVAGRAVGIGVCAALYGLVKYPYYLGSLGMSFAEATGVIVFSCAVAAFVVYIVLDRRDAIVMAIVHVFIDLVQKV